MIGAASRALLLGFWLTFAAGQAWACMCAVPRTATERAELVEDAMGTFDYIFAGIVIGSTTQQRQCKHDNESPPVACTWGIYDIWVLRIAKGEVKGITRVARPQYNGTDQPTWAPGFYVEVLAVTDNDEMRASADICNCDKAFLFSSDAPIPYWKAVLIYSIPLLATAGAFIFFARKIDRARGRPPDPPAS